MASQDQLEIFKSNLNLIKSMTGDKAQQEFYQLMQKAKTQLGELNLEMGQFYFEYAKFLIEKMQKNIDIFNAGSLPVGQQTQQQLPIQEDFLEDDSSLQNQGELDKQEINDNENQNSPKEGQNKNEANNQPQIIDENDDLKQEKPEQAAANNENQVAKEAVQGQDDDYQVCAQNLLCAIKIFQTERDRLQSGGEEGKYSLSQIKSWISRCRSRLGDLHQLCQNYTEAVSVYRQVIQEQQQKIGHESNRGLAQIHYMIANSFLYDNKQGCQKIAIQQFIKSVQILLSHLSLLNPQDTTYYQIPNLQKIKVDRFAYLPKNTDNEQVKDIKQVISCLLDKIQDTYEQISIRAQYEAEKLKNKNEEQNNKFKEVDPSTTTVVKLGTFGNRKKKPEELVDPPKKENSK